MNQDEIKRLPRLMSILTQLQSKKITTANQLAVKHGVSTRTIYRDIKALELSGIPIVTEEGKGYGLIEGYNLPPVSFTEDEANALITAQMLVSKNKDASFVKSYTEAIIKIKNVLKSKTKDKANFLSERVVFRQNAESLKTSDLLSTFQLAITNFKVVQIDYTAINDISTSNRQIEPFALYNTQENWILIAYCRLRREFRSFRLDKISECITTSEVFEAHNMTLAQYFEICRKSISTLDKGLSQSPFIFAPLNHKSKIMNHSIETFYIIGIAVRTSNDAGRGDQDIPALWNKFISESIASKIPNKISEDIYCIYTEYEGNYTQPYTTLLGCKVGSLDEVPHGMKGFMIAQNDYERFIAKGSIYEGIVFQEWVKIWNSPIVRNYKADFEVYGPHAMNPLDAVVEIFVGVSN